eukprot:14286863-Ditylum_brightwellii.AAC.1
MYPSIRPHLIRKALTYYTKELPIDAKRKVWKCTTLVKFGMKSTLFCFRDKYYKYKGAAGASADEEGIGLAIGGFESAWIANLVASYLLEMTEDHFTMTITKGIYRDDGL